MTVLGYSELMKRITGEDEYLFENTRITLSKHSLSPFRMKVLKELAKQKRSTVSSLLKNQNENTSGGSYISITRFFNDLEQEKILRKERVGNRTYWEFDQSQESFRKYLMNQAILNNG